MTHGLLQVSSDGGPPRYRMLLVIRTFTLARLQDREAAEQAFVRWFRAWGERTVAGLSELGFKDCQAMLHAERSSLHQAFTLARHEPEAAAALATVLFRDHYYGPGQAGRLHRVLEQALSVQPPDSPQRGALLHLQARHALGRYR